MAPRHILKVYIYLIKSPLENKKNNLLIFFITLS